MENLQIALFRARAESKSGLDNPIIQAISENPNPALAPVVKPELTLFDSETSSAYESMPQSVTFDA